MSPEYKVVIHLDLPNRAEASSLLTEIFNSRGVRGIQMEELYTGQPNSIANLESLSNQHSKLSPEELIQANKRRGEIILQHRTGLRMTQRELAERLRISKATITGLERGKQRGSFITLAAIADELGIPEGDPIRAELYRGCAPRTPKLAKNHPIRDRRPL